MDLEFWVLTLRIVNAVLWSVIGIRVLNGQVPLNQLARRLIATVLIFGMWTLVIGGSVPFGFPAEAARSIYSVFSAYAGLIALGLVTGNNDE